MKLENYQEVLHNDWVFFFVLIFILVFIRSDFKYLLRNKETRNYFIAFHLATKTGILKQF